MNWLILVCTAICLMWSSCQTAIIVDPLDHILNHAAPAVKKVINQKDKYEVQIIYTQIERDQAGKPILNSFNFNVDKDYYFYPASTVKMPVAFLALQRINELSRINPLIDINDILLIDSSQSAQSVAYIDSTTQNLKPTVARYIEKVFVTSDNDAYNRLYEFVGQDYINEELKKKGIFTNSRIRTRVGIGGFDTESNKYTNPWTLLDSTSGDTLHHQDEYYALYSTFDPLENTQKGIGYHDDDLDSTIMSPFDMSEKNFINLQDLEKSLAVVCFPDAFSDTERYDITPAQRLWLLDAMPKYPRHYDYLKGHDDYYDGYVKFFINGDTKEPIPDQIKIFNKVGWAYGYLTDCSYIIDTKNKVEFLLTATISVNENGIYNDGKYEYEKIGLPFFARLGKAVLEYEIKRERAYAPPF